MKFDATQMDDLARQLIDRGRIIEAGWMGLQKLALPDASPSQIATMRSSFFAGAAHLFSSIMSILGPGAEPTEKDFDRLTAIDNELRAFERDFHVHRLPTEGSA
jgi:hypothetical protein